jgi:hypothetical protein
MNLDSKARSDDMQPEYDIRGGTRGKHLERYRQGTKCCPSRPVVTEVFHDSASVDRALRAHRCRPNTCEIGLMQIRRRGWDSPANPPVSFWKVYSRHEIVFSEPLASAKIHDFPSPLLHALPQLASWLSPRFGRTIVWPPL